MPEKVYLVDQPAYDTREIRAKVRRVFEQSAFNPRARSVLVKPSFVYPARAPKNLGVITQPELIAGVAGALKDLGARRVMVAEDSLLGPSEVAFVASGVLPHLRGLAEPLYLQNVERVKVTVRGPRVQEEFLVPKPWLDADLFVSLPKIKVNMYAQVTLSVKNNLGLLLQEDRLLHHHYDLQKKIADLYKVRPPDFVIADAVVAGEAQGPMMAEPVHLGVLLAGKNGPAVDAVACHLMGFDPLEIEHLRYVAEDGLGPIDLEEIELENGHLLQERKRRLRRPRVNLDDFPSDIHFHVGTELACGPGCVGMIRNSLDPWQKYGRLKSLAGFHFIVGKPVLDLPADLPANRTIVFGDCAAPHRRRGTFLPGCPVTPLALTFSLARKGKMAPLETRLLDIGHGYLRHWWSRPREAQE
jgi:uncharacterized protein (DUF362 family)